MVEGVSININEKYIKDGKLKVLSGALTDLSA
jgi:hypothetical protein